MNISISNSLTLKAKVTKQGHSFIKKAKKDQMVKMNADALLMNTRIKLSDIDGIQASLVSYTPAAVLPFIEIDEEKWSHELADYQ